MALNVKQCFEFAVPLVQQCGKLMINADDLSSVSKTNKWDQVTKYDKQIEKTLFRELRTQYPSHKFIGEEESEEKGISKLTDDPTWIIDPIDGTSNFIKNLKLSAISVGLVIKKEQILGIVYNPYTEELYTAIKGEGAYLNGNKIKASVQQDISKAIFAYELSLGTDHRYYDLYMYRTKHLLKSVFGIRSFGTSVVSLCYVADGRLDAYQCDGLYPWDAAAGVLIVREAGGYVCDSSGKEFDLMNPNFLATSTKELADQFLEVERRADEERIRDKKA